MGTYRITYTDGAGHQQADAITEQLLALHSNGQLVAVHGPADTQAPAPQAGNAPQR
jgi:hypothetical protein